MREWLLLICILFHGCSVSKNQSKAKKDWSKIYAKELKIAIDNEDHEAFMFFWPEYLKEKGKIKNANN